MARILFGDIGGTKTLLNLASVVDGHCHVLAEQRFASGQFSTFDNLLHAFYQAADIGEGSIDAACFGVAGPVIHSSDGDNAKITNLPWQLNSKSLENRFNIKKIFLINDFESVGYGIQALTDSDLISLQQGHPIERANRLAIGAGTGLGVAMMIWCEGQYKVVPTEGGHADFAPVNDLQHELCRYLAREHGRVACENVLSGPGLVNIYRFLHYQHRQHDAVLATLLDEPDPGAAIALAADRENQVAEESMTLFVDIYGAQAGNYALASMARGGVYVAGGIAPKILSRLQTGRFLQHFNNKGKMAGLMNDIPVNVVLDSNIGLHGAREVALHAVIH